MKRALLMALVSIPSLARAEPPRLQDWSKNRPEAAAAFELWVRNHPEAATRIFKWDLEHPQRADAFFTFMAQHPDATLDSFISTHAHWPVVDLVLKPYDAAVRALIVCIHLHPPAVLEFSTRARGFAWVGYHLYKPLWRAPDTEPDWQLPVERETDVQPPTPGPL